MSVPRVERWEPRPVQVSAMRMPDQPDGPLIDAIGRWLAKRGVRVYAVTATAIWFERLGEAVVARLGHVVLVEDARHGLAYVKTPGELSASYQRALDGEPKALEQYALEYADGSRDEYEAGAKSELEVVEHAAGIERFAAQMHTGDPAGQALVATRVLRRVVTFHASEWVRVR